MQPLGKLLPLLCGQRAAAESEQRAQMRLLAFLFFFFLYVLLELCSTVDAFIIEVVRRLFNIAYRPFSAVSTVGEQRENVLYIQSEILVQTDDLCRLRLREYPAYNALTGINEFAQLSAVSVGKRRELLAGILRTLLKPRSPALADGRRRGSRCRIADRSTGIVCRNAGMPCTGFFYNSARAAGSRAGIIRGDSRIARRSAYTGSTRLILRSARITRSGCIVGSIANRDNSELTPKFDRRKHLFLRAAYPFRK